VRQIYLMRTLPVGRAMNLNIEPLTADEYRKAIDTFWQLERKHLGPKINIMCALKTLFPDRYPKDFCSVLRTTCDITANGRVILDAFAYGPNGEELFPEAIIGDLRTEHLGDIITSPEIQSLASRAIENFGHCKVAAYLNSSQRNSLDRFFDKTDPLRE
jgi:hypothetical protein